MSTNEYCKFHITLGNRNWLYQKYWIEMCSAQKIGKIIGASNHTVREWLEKHHLPIRNMKEANKTERRRIERSGQNNPGWKGGKRKSNGRVFVKFNNHPRKDSWGYVPRYWIIIEKSIGRYLREDEHIHHINGIKSDDRIENLQILSNEEHLRIHAKSNEEFIKHQFKPGHNSIA